MKDRGKDRSDGKTRKIRKQLLHSLMEKGGYWILKEEVLDRTLWRTLFGRGYGTLVRQKME
jgi:hypothetical protein